MFKHIILPNENYLRILKALVCFLLLMVFKNTFENCILSKKIRYINYSGFFFLAAEKEKTFRKLLRSFFPTSESTALTAQKFCPTLFWFERVCLMLEAENMNFIKLHYLSHSTS